MFNLENKTLFITGCGSGIGLETAKAAIELGARVYGTVFSEEQSVTVKNCLPRECIYKVNVKNSDELTAALNDAVSHSGQLNGVVAVAGTLSLQPSIQTDDINWRNTIDTNLSGSFYLARAAIPYLERQKSSSIVFVSSQIGLVGHPIWRGLCCIKGRHKWFDKINGG